MRSIRLRLAEPRDCELIWRWANDPNVRSNSLSTEPIPWETHEEWFTEALEGEGRVILIAEDCCGPIGQIRFDRSRDGFFDVGLSLAAAHRGHGLAVPLIRSGLAHLVAYNGEAWVRAVIRQSNVASQKSFEAAGFRITETRPDGTLVLMKFASPGTKDSG